MLRSRRASGPALAGGILGALALGGCGEGFVPPPPPELSAIPDVRPAGSSPTIEMVLAAPPSNERVLWEGTVRREAGVERIIFSSSRPETGAPAARQAELIRAAGDRKPSALIVEPADDPEVVEALKAVRDAGTPVVLLHRGVDAKDAGKAFPVVTYSPFPAAAKELVEAVRKEARDKNVPAETPALVVHGFQGGPSSDRMRDALVDALKEAGAPPAGVLDVTQDMEAGKALVKERVEAEPGIGIVLADDDSAYSAALAVNQDYVNAAKDGTPPARPAFLLGGTVSRDRPAGATVADCVGLVDRNISALARKALREAIALSKGESVPPVTRIPLTYESSNGRTSARPVREAGAPPTNNSPDAPK